MLQITALGFPAEEKEARLNEARTLATTLNKEVELILNDRAWNIQPNDRCHHYIDSATCPSARCDKCELCATFDLDGNPTGTAPRHYPDPHKMCIVVFLYDNDRRWLLEKRSMNCVHSPGDWSPLTGMVQAGELPEDAVKREIKEELGTEALDLHKCRTWQCKDFIAQLWTGRLTTTPTHLQTEEIDEVRWTDEQELTAVMPACFIGT